MYYMYFKHHLPPVITSSTIFPQLHVLHVLQAPSSPSYMYYMYFKHHLPPVTCITCTSSTFPQLHVLHVLQAPSSPSYMYYMYFKYHLPPVITSSTIHLIYEKCSACKACSLDSGSPLNAFHQGLHLPTSYFSLSVY